MRLTSAVLFLFILGLPTGADERTYKVNYDGGSGTVFLPGEHMTLDLYQNRLRIFSEDAQLLDVMPPSILAISCGADLHQVGAAIGLEKVSVGVEELLTGWKGTKRFVGISWDNQGTKGGAVFQLRKRNYQDAITDLERFAGKKAVHTDATALSN